MAEDSKISWTDSTFNPWMGCTKVSEECRYCYAENQMDERWKKVKWGPHGTRVVTSAKNWTEPLKWEGTAAREHRRIRVFCASLSDVFEDWHGAMVDSTGSVIYINTEDFSIAQFSEEHIWPEWRQARMSDFRIRLFNMIDATPHLDWLLLTKRPENIRRFWQGGYRKNVWRGTSAGTQDRLAERYDRLVETNDLSPIAFISAEPLLEPMDFTGYFPPGKNPRGRCRHGVPPGSPCRACDRFRTKEDSVQWVIVGGESGSDARPHNLDWDRAIRDQCRNSGIAFFMKQAGDNPQEFSHPTVTSPGPQAFNQLQPTHAKTVPLKFYARAGHDIRELPQDLQIQEYPRSPHSFIPPLRRR